MKRLFTLLCIALSAGVCIAAEGEKPVSTETTGGETVVESVAASKAISVEQIRAVDHVGEDRYALIVGINNYQDENIPDLVTCQADAKAMYQLLTDPAKGGISKKNAYLLLGKQATGRNIRRRLGKLRRIPSKSTVFVYFSGHGSKEADEAYWIAQDSRMDELFSTGLSNMEIQRYLSSIPSDRVVVMLDCCYAAATVKGGKSVASDFSVVLKQFTGKGRAYLMAAGSGQEAIEAKDLSRSVFSHYLIEGLTGRADDNKDGVVVLTELATYIDKHVADEARIRGGIQRPVVSMVNVSEPSKFSLTIDAQRIQRNIFETEQAKQLRQGRLAKLREYYLAEELSVDLYQLCRELIEKPADLLDDVDKQKLREIAAVADGKLSPAKLHRALDAIETSAQRRARLASQAREAGARQRQVKIDELLGVARANNNKKDGKRALSALEELLVLSPGHSEGLSLQTKISDYYGPSRGDVITNSIGMKLTFIPAGEFIMGSPSNEAGREKDEGPQRQVKLTKGFYMSVYEVTRAQYRAIMGKNSRGAKGDNYIAHPIRWKHAMEFCRKLSSKEGKTYRLPTEAEWEYACRAGTTTSYSFGDKWNAAASRQANPWGLYDMHRNPSEWCSDRYANSYANAGTSDPQGPSSGRGRVRRGGGGLDDGPPYCRSAIRHKTNLGGLFEMGGAFRVALVPE